MTFSHEFTKDIESVLDFVRTGKNFALARYADGEYHVMNALRCTGCDGWTVGPEDAVLAGDLFEAYGHQEDNYFYGISCPCCDPPKYEFLKANLKQSWDKVTFSNIFVNANYKVFKNFIETLDRSPVLIVNEAGEGAKYPFKEEESIYVPDDVIKWYREEKTKVQSLFTGLAKKYKDTLFLISAGPLSELIISIMYKCNSNNCYIDVGSSLDNWTHSKQTRLYHSEHSEFSERLCTFN